MTQEEKQLLLKDLCARLPYGVHVDIYSWQKDSPKLLVECIPEYVGEEIVVKNIVGRHPIKEVKPYLRPMSSMTEEECLTLSKLKPYGIDAWKYIKTPIPLHIVNIEQFDFFHLHHLDWRGLIPMGLALEAPEDMYNSTNIV